MARYLLDKTGNTPAPPEYMELVLCRDVFHVTPSELRAMAAREVLPMMLLHNMERMGEAWWGGNNKAGSKLRMIAVRERWKREHPYGG